MALRSLLFVPGSRPERFDKAVAAGADLVCIDLEDAVLPEDKDDARRSVCDWLNGRDLDRICVRINPAPSEIGQRDLEALAQVSGLRWLMLPKVSNPSEVEQVAALMPSVRLIALIESPTGVLDAAAIAATGVHALMFGAADFSAEMGCEMNWEPLLAARGQLALAAGQASIALIDVPYLDINNDEGLKHETARVKALGFTAKAAIHPRQVIAINEVFTPTAEQIEAARDIIEAVANDENAAGVVNGKFVDRPIILRARLTLTQAGELGSESTQ